MSRQIDEMRDALLENIAFDHIDRYGVAYDDVNYDDSAENMVAAGYRKASDVAREILEKLVEYSTFGLVDIDYAFKIAKEMGVDVKNGKC
ncbi:MAG: hypothetical protein IJX39_08820 [Clostridia bacterium]|nr:hypothetical protein [Clostridia bacterium]